MKRLYLALGFLAIAVSLCIFEQYTVSTVYREATAYIAAAEEKAGNGDYEGAKAVCAELKAYWDKKEKYMAAMIDHGMLDDAGVTVNSLEALADSESDSLSDELITAENQIRAIYENQRITFGNVF